MNNELDVGGVKCRIVPMQQVPAPSLAGNSRGGWVCDLYVALLQLPGGEKNAIEVKRSSEKEIYSVRQQLRVKAKRDGRVLLSSRTPDRKTIYLWLEDVRAK